MSDATSPPSPGRDVGLHEVEAGARDILVCTHGARDACCGKFGYGFYVEMRGLAAVRGDGVRVWRTSHLGGHRFAPTPGLGQR